MNGMALPKIIALPGTLMDSASLDSLSVALGLPFDVQILGVEDDFYSEIERLHDLSTEPVIWLGHSLGGIAALHLADRYPKCCAALILMASNLRADGPLGPQARARQQAALEQGGLSQVVHHLLAPVYGLAEEDPLVKNLAAQAHRVGLDRFRRQLAYAAHRPGLLAEHHSLTVPVLALSAQNDPLSPPACGEEIMAKVTGAKALHVTLEGAGHLLPVQHPNWCAQHIGDFLATAS